MTRTSSHHRHASIDPHPEASAIVRKISRLTDHILEEMSWCIVNQSEVYQALIDLHGLRLTLLEEFPEWHYAITAACPNNMTPEHWRTHLGFGRVYSALKNYPHTRETLVAAMRERWRYFTQQRLSLRVEHWAPIRELHGLPTAHH